MKNWQTRAAVSFLLLTPLITLLLLRIKGLPDFALDHPREVFVWIYSVTWIPALSAGVLLAGCLSLVVKRTTYFHHPYDFGRSISLGAILGALSEALTTFAYREISNRPFSDFWIAGAMIAGCLAGALITSVTFKRISLSRTA